VPAVVALPPAFHQQHLFFHTQLRGFGATGVVGQLPKGALCGVWLITGVCAQKIK
jgi:hypothetical protein